MLVLQEGEIRTKMQHRGMHIMNGQSVFLSLVAEGIGRSVRDTTAHTSAGHPYSEALWIMIPSVITDLEHGHATKFRAADYQRIF